MRLFYLIILGATTIQSNSQITQINTGTSASLSDISIINNNIMIQGDFNYLVKSNNECNTLTPVNSPDATVFARKLIRVDQNNIYLGYYDQNKKMIYKSIDGGNNWNLKLDTSGGTFLSVGFFSISEGVITHGTKILKTVDGGDNWSVLSTPINPPFGIPSMGIFGDSLICVGDMDNDFFLSTNRAASWPIWGYVGGGQGAYPLDYAFLSKDTILVTGAPGIWSSTIAKTTDGGDFWQVSPCPINLPMRILFKESDEGYIVGSDIQNKGVVAKTNDLGHTWSIYNTGINTRLNNIAFLNDSIAFLIGTNGTLLRWNYKNTVFTGIEDTTFTENGFRIFPNPTKDKFILENRNKNSVVIEISNSLGQLVLQTISDGEREEFNTSTFPRGVFFLKIQSLKGSFVKKLVKE